MIPAGASNVFTCVMFLIAIIKSNRLLPTRRVLRHTGSYLLLMPAFIDLMQNNVQIVRVTAKVQHIQYNFFIFF